MIVRFLTSLHWFVNSVVYGITSRRNRYIGPPPPPKLKSWLRHCFAVSKAASLYVGHIVRIAKIGQALTANLLFANAWPRSGRIHKTTCSMTASIYYSQCYQFSPSTHAHQNVACELGKPATQPIYSFQIAPIRHCSRLRSARHPANNEPHSICHWTRRFFAIARALWLLVGPAVGG